MAVSCLHGRLRAVYRNILRLSIYIKIFLPIYNGWFVVETLDEALNVLPPMFNGTFEFIIQIRR